MPKRALTTAMLLVLLAAVVASVASCGSAPHTAGGTGLSASKASVPAPPSGLDLSTPESAVRAYLAWTSYAYVVGDSDIASKAVDPYELVRVDSYIEFNRENGAKAIYQLLEDFRVRGTSTEGTHTLVAASEKWRYRYFSLKDQSWMGPVRETPYETTYTVYATDSRYVVGSVEASATGPVY